MRFDKYLVTFLLSLIALLSCESDSDTSLSGDNTGQGGSTTRYAINGNYLYMVDDSSIKVFNIANNTFLKLNEVSISFGLETIFARGEYLYLGARDGMYIYSITQPQNPSFIFRYAHIVSCDPVVVQGNRAYVTLRSEAGFCNRGTNALEIIDITNHNNPSLVKNYPMLSPHGLGVFNNFLFICEGDNGLKLYDISDEQNIQLISHLTNLTAYDVIIKNDLAIVTGKDGIFQYRFTDQGLTLESKIDVMREDV